MRAITWCISILYEMGVVWLLHLYWPKEKSNTTCHRDLFMFVLGFDLYLGSSVT